MKLYFDELDIKKNGEIILIYEDLKKEDGYRQLYILLRECVRYKENFECEMSEKCPPFGKKLRDIILNEFQTVEV